MLVVTLVALPLASAGAVNNGNSSPSSSFTPAITGLPVQFGGFITLDRHYLVFSGVTSWGGAFTPIANNSQVYASSIELVVYSLLPTTSSLDINLLENGAETSQTVSVDAAGVPAVVSVNLEPIHAWTQATLIIDGTSQTYSVAVPLSFLPSNIANVGGLDLIALAIISECLVALAIAVSMAYGFQRKEL